MFSNIRIRTLLSSGFGIIIGLVVIMAAVVYERSSNVSGHITQVTRNAYPKMTFTETIRLNIMRNWANSLLLLQVTNADDSNRVKDEMVANSKVITEQFDALEKSINSDKGKDLLAKMKAARADYTEHRAQFLDMLKSGKKDEADRFLAGILKEKLEAYVEAVKAMNDFQADKIETLSTETLGLAAGLSTIILLLSTLVVIVSIAAALIVVRVIGHALGGEVFYSNEIAREIAAGNLAVEVRTMPGDNTSLLASMKAMRDKLREMVSSIGISAAQVGQSARDLAQASKSVAESSEKQSAAASASAAAIEEMTVSISQIADSTKEAHTLSINSESLSRRGSEVIHHASAEMGKIAESVEASSAIIGRLEEQSKEISAIVNVIKEIADQTNLLALNAAIEAARAGEQGRGFAVVADEVRKLADRTSHSTQEIALTIKKIQDGTRNAVQSMVTGVEQVHLGTALAQQAGSSIVEIQSETGQVVVVVNGIADSLKEQTAASNEIARNIENISSMVEENNMAASKAAAAAQQLNQLADGLSHSIGSFRL